MAAMLPLSRRRRRERQATEAVTVLCYEAFVSIRGSAYTGQVQSMTDAGPTDVAVIEWIRSLADACHNLPPALRPSVANGRKHRATAAMQYLLATAGPLQRQWITTTLTTNGIAPENLIR